MTLPKHRTNDAWYAETYISGSIIKINKRIKVSDKEHI